MDDGVDDDVDDGVDDDVGEGIDGGVERQQRRRGRRCGGGRWGRRDRCHGRCVSQAGVHDSVFVYARQPYPELYGLSFIDAGEGRGDYIQDLGRT
jgi:hypothetical protein